MSVHELKALARKHWTKWLPEKVAELKAEGRLDEALQGAANLAQQEIEYLMKHGHCSVDEAREVALPQFILLPPEDPDGDLDDEQREELAEEERFYRKHPPVFTADESAAHWEEDQQEERALKQYELGKAQAPTTAPAAVSQTAKVQNSPAKYLSEDEQEDRDIEKMCRSLQELVAEQKNSKGQKS